MSVNHRGTLRPLSVQNNDALLAQVSPHLSSVLKALSDVTRVRILWMLQEREYCVRELTSNFHLSQPTISRHLGVLKNADLVVSRRNGQHVFYCLSAKELNSAMQELIGGFRRPRAQKPQAKRGPRRLK